MPAFDFVLAGRYRLVGPLGEGGMAVVYRGRDLRLNREIAIKVLHDDLNRDPEFLRRFDREAQFVASLSHPNIVPVYDVGEEQGTHFIVMEYIRGRTLKELLDHEGALPPDQAVGILTPVLQALQYAHERGLIHRDVKPQNILLSQDGVPRLADFGVARLADGSTSRTATILGSAHYLSPEQSRGEEATVQSDIYAVGVVLYEMLSGKPPFDGPNALAIANQHLSTPPPPLRPHRLPLDEPLVGIVMRALAKLPEERFDDAASFALALQTLASETLSTSVQPLSLGGHTAIQPLQKEAAEQPADEALEPSGARPLHRRSDAVVVLRRSTRKTYVTAALALVATVGLARAASLSVAGYSLPQYPSAPYLALPVLLIVVVILSWAHTRSWIYQLDDNAAVVQWGLLAHRRFGVPLRQVATVQLRQSPIDRVLGVGTVELFARDQHGEERRLVMEDVPRPRQAYEELMRLLAGALRSGRSGP